MLTTRIGAYGIVLHCKKNSTGKHYAMKVQTKRGLLENYAEHPTRVLLEKDAMASCHHPFIVSMDYALQTTELVLMVMDLGRSMLLEGIYSKYIEVMI